MSEERVRFYPKMSSMLDGASADSQVELAQAMQARANSSEAQAAANLDANDVRLEPSTCVEAETFALRVLDDSMQPEFRKGCIILIDPTGRAKEGCYVLAKITGNADNDDAIQSTDNNADEDEALLEQYLFRQLKQDANKQWYLHALNEQYQHKPINIDLKDIEGVIVQRAGTRLSYHKHYD